MHLILLVLAATVIGSAGGQTGRPDFSGRWVFDLEASARPGPDGRIVLAAMLGDEFVAEQDATELRLTISANGQTVRASYKLDGEESRNVSPGEVVVLSRATWEGDRLVVTSRSTSNASGSPVTVETRRVMWLEGPDRLILDRSGTPASEVTPSRSVYVRAKR